MVQIVTAALLLAALTAVVFLWSPLLHRLTGFVARYILPMQPGIEERRSPAKRRSSDSRS